MNRGNRAVLQQHLLSLCIARVAQEKGYTQSRLVSESHLSPTTINTLWNNQRCDPKLSTLDRIAQVLGVSIDDLIEHSASIEATAITQ